ncbi:hypothetical protein KIPB_005569, partial [Kipferlia bialata]
IFDVAPFSPAVQCSVIMAMSVDYSLFLLSRFKREIQLDASLYKAMCHMIRYSGRTILTSGLTLAISFAGLMFFKVDMISTIGMCSAISLVVMIAVSTTLTPAVLAMAPRFFSTFRFNKAQRKQMSVTQVMQSLGAVMAQGGGEGIPSDDTPSATPTHAKTKWVWIPEACAPGTGEAEAELREQREEEQEEKERQTSMFFRFSAFIHKKWLSATIIGVAIAACLPLAYLVVVSPGIVWSVDMNQLLPKGGDSVETLNKFGENFSTGLMLPFYIVLEPTDPRPVSEASDVVFNQAMWDLQREIATQLLDSDEISDILTRGNIMGVSWAGVEVPLDMASKWYSGECPARPDKMKEMCNAYKYALSLTLSPVYSACTMMLSPNLPVDGVRVPQFSQITHAVLESDTVVSLSAAAGVTPVLSSMVLDEMDTVNYMGDVFPFMVVITSMAVMLVIVVSFAGVVPPLRLVVCLLILTCITFGTMIMSYQIFSDYDGAYWSVPFIIWPICMGLAADYDIFFYVAVREHRERGCTTVVAVRRALHSVGPTIIAAGVVMAAAFAALMTSSIPMLDEFGVLLLVDIVANDLLMVMLVTPAMISLLGESNWWPSSSKMPVLTEADKALEAELAIQGTKGSTSEPLLTSREEDTPQYITVN